VRDIVIDCSQSGWEERLEAHLQKGGEAYLIHFNLGYDSVFCVNLAERYGVEFRPSQTRDVTEITIRKDWKHS